MAVYNAPAWPTPGQFLGNLGDYPGGAPTLTIPSWDKAIPKMDQGVISSYKQQMLAPKTTGLRNALRETATRAGSVARDNPYAAKEVMRGALSGYGQGLGEASAAAQSEAMSQYLPEYQAQNQAAQSEYQAQVQGALTKYGAEMQPYSKYLGLQTMAPMVTKAMDQINKHVYDHLVPRYEYDQYGNKTQTGDFEYVGQPINFNPFQLLGYA